MFFHLFSVEETVEEPQSNLDCTWSPLARRPLRQRCPVLHLFGTLSCRTAVSPTPLSRLPSPSLSSTLTSSETLQNFTAVIRVHGVYPFMYVRQRRETCQAEEFGWLLESMAQKAKHLFPHVFRTPFDGKLRSIPMVLYDVQIVERLPIYGFSSTPFSYYKIVYNDPRSRAGIRELLNQMMKPSPDTTCKNSSDSRIQIGDVCESHLSYTSAWMAQMGLTGGQCIPLGSPVGHASRSSTTPIIHMSVDPLKYAEFSSALQQLWDRSGSACSSTHENEHRSIRFELPSSTNYVVSIRGVSSPRGPMEVEVDVPHAAVSLLFSSHSAAMPPHTAATQSAALSQLPPHFQAKQSQMRRLFHAFGIPDELRTAVDISQEEKLQERLRLAVPGSRHSPSPAELPGRRVGSVSSIQAQDSVVRSQFRKLSFLQLFSL